MQSCRGGANTTVWFFKVKSDEFLVNRGLDWWQCFRMFLGSVKSYRCQLKLPMYHSKQAEEIPSVDVLLDASARAWRWMKHVRLRTVGK